MGIGVGNFLSELRWGGHAVRARGWRAGLIVGMLGVALAASTVIFSAADSFVLGRVPYPNADRLMVLERTSSFSGTDDYLRPASLAEWRKHTDVFSAIHAHDRGRSIYLTVGDVTELVGVQEVTPGLFEALGVSPKWGRLLQPGDEAPDRPPVAIVGEDVARRVFGDPASAVGQWLRAGDESLRIVGVMHAGFRFPTARERIWQPLDLSRWPENSGLRGLFQRAPGVSAEQVAAAVRDRGAAVARVERFRRKEVVQAVPMVSAGLDARIRLIFMTLMGGALCVVLIACANVGSLELASAMTRERNFAIHAALGAGRASLVRTACAEAAFMMGGALVLGWVLARWGVDLLAGSLPPAMSNPLANPIDLDGRALAFLGIVAAAAWSVTSLPVALRASRATLLEVLKREGRAARLPIGAGMRQFLTVAQVALTVVLLVGAVLVLRTYTAQVALAKGFDSRAVAGISVLRPSNSSVSAAILDATLLARLRAQPGIRSVSRTDAIPPSTGAGIGGRLTIEGRPALDESIKLATYVVDPEYFAAMGIRLLAGRVFNAADPPGTLVVDEAFARRFWPDGDALGARFRVGTAGFAGAREFQIVGVTAHVRADSSQTPGGNELFLVYGRIPATYSPLAFVARLDDERQLGALVTLVRQTAPGSVIRADLIDDRYERLYGDVRLAASVTSGFGLLAFALAMAGVYGVMLFLVTARKREIGVRLALGASPSVIHRMVLRSSAKLVIAGVVLGALGAAFVSRYIESLLFGVSPSDPATFAAVAVAVSATALAATWLPARYAARVDPAITLRAE